MKPELLVTTKRGGFAEKLHYGFIFLIDENFNLVSKIGEDNNIPFPFRSAAKPLQASVVIDSGVFNHFGLDNQELAVICASHSGTKQHTEKIKNILKKCGLAEEDLQCGIHAPLDEEEKRILIRENKDPELIHHNCSGKHAGMLSVCTKNDWDISSYLELDHPLQKEIMKKIWVLCNLDRIPESVSDGCSAPVPVLPHYNMGVGFLKLFLDEKYTDIKLAMSQNPYLSGGKGRLDSEIINASSGKLIAKVGAEGLCIVINTEIKKVLAVKILDADYKARSIAVVDSLQQLGWLSGNQIQQSEGLQKLYDKKIKNTKGSLVGEIKTVFKL